MVILLVFPILSSLFFFTESATSISSDALSLLSIKRAVSLDASNLLSSWNLTINRNHCEWRGVTCDDRVSKRVTSLNITGTMTSFLSGTLAGEVGSLSELRVISLPHNAFTGVIPVEITRLESLEILELQRNRFSGFIPGKLIGFSRIKTLDLSYNKLSGPIRIDSTSRCESLTHLKLSSNFLTEEIPPQIGNCSNLKSLLLDKNTLEYRIPAEIGQISQLEILDVSRNSLTDKIPRELGKCSELSSLVLTDLIEPSPLSSRGEFNAFDGGIPSEVFLLPKLEILWAPRANLGGRIPGNWTASCKLRTLNLEQNYITGSIPERMGFCRNLTYFDLSSNLLLGSIPPQLQVPCMPYFNVSRNSLSGNLQQFSNSNCTNSLASYGEGRTYFEVPIAGAYVVVHDFSWNNFSGGFRLFSFGDGFTSVRDKALYKLLLNNNQFNGSFPGMLFSACEDLGGFMVSMSRNSISGEIPHGLLFNCSQLTGLEAAYNQLSGTIPPSISDSQMLKYLDLRGNRLNGSIPDEVGKMEALEWIHLGGNNLIGEFPTKFSQLTFLLLLDLSENSITGSIPASLANATKLQVLLLDHNRLSGEIPSSFSTLVNLTTLDVSFNHLSGRIPSFKRLGGCDGFKGNDFVEPCVDPYLRSSSSIPDPFEVHKGHGMRNKAKVVIITLVASASALLFILVTVLLLVSGRGKFGKLATLEKKLVVTFLEVPTELNYDNLVRATGNFSVQYLIGTGGFGATYKAELVPGFLVAVKRLSIGRFQGVQQFDAEIRTLGRIRHKNLVTLIGYHMGEAEMFLIYNYLSGGNLETFIHGSSVNNVQWSVIHKIALDIAQALSYLHESCVPRIVHRDIKPSNILLDEDLNAYLSDFGLARLLEVSETHATTDVAGTFGYVAPEYAMTCRVSDKADVYSFGVVLLELISQKRSLDPSFSDYGNGFNIVSLAILLINECRSSEFFSSDLWESGPQEKLLGMLKLAAACTVESLSIRPSMKQVAEKLKQLKFPES